VLTWSGAEMTAGWWALPSVAEDGSGYALVTLATQYQGST
jgi:hypothetical protein